MSTTNTPVVVNHITPLMESVEMWYEKAKKKFNLPNWKKPSLDMFTLQGTKGGTATLQSNLISVNFTLYTQNKEKFLRQTVGHEMAHLVNYQLNGLKQDGHGNKWKIIMSQLGLPADRCHNYDVSSLTKKVVVVFPYFCTRCGQKYNLSSKQHCDLIANKTKKCTCARCHSPVIYSGKPLRQ